MTDLETLLREHFSAEADVAPTSADLRGGVERLRGRRRRHRLVGAVVAVAAAFIAAAIATPLALLTGGPAHRVADSSLGSSAAPGPAVVARPGEVVWAGIAFTVPAGWAVGTYPCGAPHNAVVYPSYGTYNCPAHPPSATPVSALVLGLSGTAPFAGGTDTTVAGLAAKELAAAWQSNFFSYTVYVPSRQATFTLSGPLPETPAAASILGTARVVTAGAHGCPVRVDFTDGTAAALPGARRGGKPESPVRALVCGYGGSYLIGGRLVTNPVQAAQLAQAFARAPAQYTSGQLDAQRYSETIHGPMSCAVVQRAVVTFTYPDGVSAPLVVQSVPCEGSRPGVSGGRTSTLTDELGNELGALLPGGFYDGDVTGLLPDGCAVCTLGP